MLKQTEVTRKKIGEYTFYIKPFPAFVAANVSGELTQVVAPVIGSLGALFNNGNETESEGVMDMEIDDALPAFSDALASLSGDKLEGLMKKLLIQHKNIHVSGEMTNGEAELLDMDMANEIFCGELQDMFILCFEVIKVNYSGFFKKIAGRFGSLRDITGKIAEVRTSGESST